MIANMFVHDVPIGQATNMFRSFQFCVPLFEVLVVLFDFCFSPALTTAVFLPTVRSCGLHFYRKVSCLDRRVVGWNALGNASG